MQGIINGSEDGDPGILPETSLGSSDVLPSWI
jgi:hypothetical protein